MISHSSLITPTIVLITGHFSNSAQMLKFHGKFRGSTRNSRPAENCGP